MRSRPPEPDQTVEPGHQRRALRALLPYLWPPRGASDIWLELRVRVVVEVIAPVDNVAVVVQKRELLY